ncbi:MAG: hypothetical protein ABIU05_07935 [Nitrospirales bacterium]
MNLLVSALIAIALCAVGYFFLQLPGKAILQAHFRLKRLRKQLDPLALTLGAVGSSRLNEEKGESLLTYKFPDGNFIVLTVGSDGFTVWSPNWNPGFEKHIEGLEPFMSAINKLHT